MATGWSGLTAAMAGGVLATVVAISGLVVRSESIPPEVGANHSGQYYVTADRPPDPTV